MKRVCPVITGLPLDEANNWKDGMATVRVRETFSEFIDEELDPK